MNFFLNNDDGIWAEGLLTLAKEIRKIGKVLIVAPDREQSATSHSLTLHRPLRINKIEPDRYAVDGTPTDAVMVAFHGLLKRKKPDLLISGINQGPNLGDDVTYSGTVAAAIEGTLLGIPSIAVSHSNWVPGEFGAAARWTARFVQKLAAEKLPPGTFLNINFPRVPKNRRFSHYQITKLGARKYNDVIIRKTDPRGKHYYWIGGEPTYRRAEETDFTAVAAGKVSITPLKVDLTDYAALSYLQNWKLKI
jgi:5'-nucleotidase